MLILLVEFVTVDKNDEGAFIFSRVKYGICGFLYDEGRREIRVT